MSIELQPENENCFDVYWKIENFSYCWEEIKSPEFICSRIPCRLILLPTTIECKLSISPEYFPDYENFWKSYEISFLTCDGSSPLNGSRGECLRVSKNIVFVDRRSAFLPQDTLTIRYRFLTDSESGKFFVRSRIGVKRESFLFTSRYFNGDQTRFNKCLEKSERYGDIQVNSRMKGGINTEKELSFEIHRSGGEKCYLVFKVSLLDEAGSALKEVSGEFFFVKADYQSKEFQIIKESTPFACTDLLVPNKAIFLTLKCDFSISLGELTEQSAVVSYDEDVTPLIKESDISIYFEEKSGSHSTMDLQTDLKSILVDGTLSDVAIKVNSEVIKVHKSLLIARSPVFKRMFDQAMKETIDGAVVIEDLDVDTVRRLILYMYTDKIPAYQWEDIKRLYFAADKYEVSSCKKKCVSLIKANLSTSNVCEVLVLANMHEDKDLKAAAVSFISMHGFSVKKWKEFEEYDFSLAHQTLLDICLRGQFH